jgi:UDP-2,3-diacylglucosamine hydrolase
MLGIIAGNGNFPLIFAKEAKKAGENVIAVALHDETDKTIETIVDKTYWINVGQFSKLVEILKKENIKKCAMVGQVKHTKLFSVKPDLKAITLLAK